MSRYIYVSPYRRNGSPERVAAGGTGACIRPALPAAVLRLQAQQTRRVLAQDFPLIGRRQFRLLDHEALRRGAHGRTVGPQAHAMARAVPSGGVDSVRSR